MLDDTYYSLNTFVFTECYTIQNHAYEFFTNEAYTVVFETMSFSTIIYLSLCKLLCKDKACIVLCCCWNKKQHKPFCSEFVLMIQILALF